MREGEAGGGGGGGALIRGSTASVMHAAAERRFPKKELSKEGVRGVPSL